MSISDLGSIGELVGAVGVIASLIYLAAQIRGAKRMARAQNVREVFDGLRRTLGLISADSELAEIWTRGHSHPDDLSEVDRVRFRLLMTDYVLTYREAQIAYREGMLSDADHGRLLDLIASALKSEGGARVWAYLQHAVSEDLAGALGEARGRVAAYQPEAEFPLSSFGKPEGAA